MDRNNLLTYTDFNETLRIHTNASNLELRAVISQKGKPISFRSINLLIPKEGI